MKKSARRDRTRSKHSTLFSLFLLLFPPLLSSRSFFNMPRARTHTRDVQRCCPFKYFSLRLTSWPLYLEKYCNFAWSAQQLTLSVPNTISFSLLSFHFLFLSSVALLAALSFFHLECTARLSFLSLSSCHLFSSWGENLALTSLATILCSIMLPSALCEFPRTD